METQYVVVSFAGICALFTLVGVLLVACIALIMVKSK